MEYPTKNMVQKMDNSRQTLALNLRYDTKQSKDMEIQVKLQIPIITYQLRIHMHENVRGICSTCTCINNVPGTPFTIFSNIYSISDEYIICITMHASLKQLGTISFTSISNDTFRRKNKGIWPKIDGVAAAVTGAGAATPLLKIPPVVAPEAAGRLGAGAVVTLRAWPTKIRSIKMVHNCTCVSKQTRTGNKFGPYTTARVIIYRALCE